MPMGKRYVSKEVECPFYHSEDFCKIYCEGVNEMSSIHLAFGSVTALKEYKQRYCKKDYKRCRLAEMLYKKYEVEDESKRVN